MRVPPADSWDFKQSTRNISPTINQANIVDLHPASVYSIRMYSFNKIGRSEPSKELTVSTEEAGELLARPWSRGQGRLGPTAPSPLAVSLQLEEGRGGEGPRNLFESALVHQRLSAPPFPGWASGSCPWSCPASAPAQPVWKGQICRGCSAGDLNSFP